LKHLNRFLKKQTQGLSRFKKTAKELEARFRQIFKEGNDTCAAVTAALRWTKFTDEYPENLEQGSEANRARTGVAGTGSHIQLSTQFARRPEE
jgi:hypothetical protein